MSIVQHMVSTQQSQRFCFKWTIEKYKAVEAEGTSISQPFTTGGPEGGPVPRRWRVILHPKGDSQESIGFLSFFCCLRPGQAGGPLTASCKYSIKSATNNDYLLGPYVHVYSIEKLSWGVSKFIPVEELARRSSDLLPNGTLTVTCEVEVMLERKSEEVKENVGVHGPKLSEDVQQYLKSQKSDVTLVVNGSGLVVHKFILCARSPVFAAMFEHETEEKLTGEVMIKDFCPEVVRGLIHFMYSDQTPENMADKTAVDLLEAADKYQILRLKCLCEIHLKRCITVETVLDILNVAMMHDSPVLKEACVRFGKANMNEVKGSEAWKQCTDIEVVKLLFSQ